MLEKANNLLLAGNEVKVAEPANPVDSKAIAFKCLWMTSNGIGLAMLLEKL